MPEFVPYREDSDYVSSSNRGARRGSDGRPNAIYDPRSDYDPRITGGPDWEEDEEEPEPDAEQVEDGTWRRKRVVGHRLAWVYQDRRPPEYIDDEPKAQPEPLEEERSRFWRTEGGKVLAAKNSGLSYREIAAVTGKAEGTVKATVNQARKRYAELYPEGGFS